MKTNTRSALMAAARIGALICGTVNLAFGSSVTYLQSASDKFQRTVDVYTDADAAGNHFAARGEFDASHANLVPPMDEISASAACFDITCITATFDPHKTPWGGWYFLNGVLPPAARQPVPNWGDQPDAGYDLTGATLLRFWAKGAVGGEIVHFFAFGVGNTEPPFQPFPDSSRKVEVPGGAVTLGKDWAEYRIPLDGADLRYVLGGFGWAANLLEDGRVQPPITFYMDNIQYLKARLDDPRLLVSYETIKSLEPIDIVLRNAAFVYDNAVAAIAFIGSGDLPRAKAIGDALVYVQDHDRFFTDGRIRNAYQGGDSALPPGWLAGGLKGTARMPGWFDPVRANWFEDETQVSTNTGNVAWSSLALLHLWEVTKDTKYLTAAQKLGDWVLSNTAETRREALDLGGFTGGYDGWENGAVSGGGTSCASGVYVQGQCKRLYKSTEHNIDLYSMFSRLYLADGQSRWATAAQKAKHFFLRMWDPQNGRFLTGTIEDGVTISADVIPLDIQAWALQALGSEAQPYSRSLLYAESNHKTSLGYGFKQSNNDKLCGDHTWFEGTSQVALTYFLLGDRAKWQSILQGVHSVQTPTGGVPATDGSCLNTGFTLNDGTAWKYYPRTHVGATGWLALAENGVNPYRSELYSPTVNSRSLSFGSVDVNEAGGQTVTINNPGPLTLSNVTVSITGPDKAAFTEKTSCDGNVGPRATCVVSVTFRPNKVGAQNATLSITEISDPSMQPGAWTVVLSGVGRPAISPGGVTNSASFKSGAVAPGSLVAIFGNGLSSSIGKAEKLPLPTNLGGASATLNGISVPFLYASPSQINVQIPFEMSPGVAKLVLTVDSTLAASVNIQISPTEPGIFLFPMRHAAATNSDGSINSTMNPAKTDSIITVYFTGQGALDNPVGTGAPTPLAPLSRALALTQATINGLSAPVIFSGMTPTLAGLAQANIRVPSGLAPGDYDVVLTVGNGVSNSALVSVGP